jgi:hypothetical protein
MPTQEDPMALPGLEVAMRELVNYCPVTLVSTKAVESIGGDDRTVGVSHTERIFRSNIRLGYGIILAGLCCPIFWISFFAGVTGSDLLWHAAVSGLIALAGLLLAGWYRIQLGRHRRAEKKTEPAPASAR